MIHDSDSSSGDEGVRLIGRKVNLEFALDVQRAKSFTGRILSDDGSGSYGGSWLVQTSKPVEISGIAWRYFLIPSPGDGLRPGAPLAWSVTCIPSAAVISGEVGKVAEADQGPTARVVLSLNRSPPTSETIDRRGSWVFTWLARLLDLP